MNIKRADIQPCAACGKGVMHDNMATFYRVKIDYMLANFPAIQRQTGLDMMIGNTVIAQALGPDEDIAIETSSQSALLCFDCAVMMPIAQLAEMLAEKQAMKEGQ